MWAQFDIVTLVKIRTIIERRQMGTVVGYVYKNRNPYDTTKKRMIIFAARSVYLELST